MANQLLAGVSRRLRVLFSSAREQLGAEGRPTRIAALVALAAIIASAGFLRLEAIGKSMPYPRHIDEPLLTEPAAAILKTGDFNPHYFMYPSLPIYLTAAAFTVGYLSAATHGDLTSTAEIGTAGYPFYFQPRVVKPAFVLFVGFSLLTFAGIGWVGYQLVRCGGGNAVAALFLGPMVLFFSKEFFHYSQNYLNVNLFGDAFFWLLAAYLLWRFEVPGFLEKSVIPGILAGLVLGCKYNFLWIVVPPLLVIFFQGKTQRIAKSAVLLAVTVLTFLAGSPFCILDFSAFLNDFAKIASIYHQGFLSAESEPGWRHFWRYVSEIAGDFGTTSLVLALLGAISAFRVCWRRALVVVSFPLLVLAHMSQQRAHFLRNVLSGFPLYALLVGFGLWVCWRGIGRALEHRRAAPPRWRPWLAFGLTALLALLILPIGRVKTWRAQQVDSRNVMTSWIIDNVPLKTTLVVPAELSMDLRPLTKAGYHVESFPFISLGARRTLARIAAFDDPYLLLPTFNSNHWDPAFVAAHRDTAEDLGQLARYHDPEKIVGGGEISTVFASVLAGNPSISAGRLALDEKERVELVGSRWIDVESFVGKGSKAVAGRLFLFAKGSQVSPELELEAGSYRIRLTCSGTTVKDRPARLRVSFGDQTIGIASCAEKLAEQTFDFVSTSAKRAAFSVELINDAIERSADGGTKDRNANLHAFSFHPIDPETVSPSGAEQTPAVSIELLAKPPRRKAQKRHPS